MYLSGKGSLHKDMLEEWSTREFPSFICSTIHFRIVSILTYLSGPCKLIHLRNTFFVISFPCFSIECCNPAARRFSGVRCGLGDLVKIDRASLTRSTNSSVDSRIVIERTA